uniref:Uncharacterized protein n=1 Tax=Rhizophora mucronata TaxID=61149 RepID=A0A2P2QPG6_RHIMU
MRPLVPYLCLMPMHGCLNSILNPHWQLFHKKNSWPFLIGKYFTRIAFSTIGTDK